MTSPGREGVPSRVWLIFDHGASFTATACCVAAATWPGAAILMWDRDPETLPGDLVLSLRGGPAEWSALWA